jgi:hypothetical protein
MVIFHPMIMCNSKKKKRDRMNQMPLDEAKDCYVGVPYSLCVAHEITSEGYGFSVSCDTGTITDVFQPSLEE